MRGEASLVSVHLKGAEWDSFASSPSVPAPVGELFGSVHNVAPAL